MEQSKTKFQRDPFLIDLKGVADLMSVSTRTVVRLHKKNKIRLYRLGGKLFAKHDELKKDLEAILEPLSCE